MRHFVRQSAQKLSKKRLKFVDKPVDFIRKPCFGICMAFKRSAVRSRLSPPKYKAQNRYISTFLSFFIFIYHIPNWIKMYSCASCAPLNKKRARSNPRPLSFILLTLISAQASLCRTIRQDLECYKSIL